MYLCIEYLLIFVPLILFALRENDHRLTWVLLLLFLFFTYVYPYAICQHHIDFIFSTYALFLAFCVYLPAADLIVSVYVL